MWNNASSNSLIDGLSSLSSGPVLKDRLLTDTMLNQQQLVVGATSHTDSSCTSQEDLTVNAEHSYSLGGSTSTNSTFGSDGDSMPESPLSLDDGNLRDFHFSFLSTFSPLVIKVTAFWPSKSERHFSHFYWYFLHDRG